MKRSDSKNKFLVTGGAGFIGSHLVGKLIEEGYNVVAADDFSNGSLANIETFTHDPRFRLLKIDLKNSDQVERCLDDVNVVFHLAANSEVRVGETAPSTHFNKNLKVTLNLLEAMIKSRTAKTIIFTSTSTIYGEPSIIPTPEDYGPLYPISTYGASKLACEAFISSYVHTFKLKGLIFRLANIVGPRSQQGVIIDFINKLKKDPQNLEILGDGTQKKSYLYIEDCIQAILYSTLNFLEGGVSFDVYNIGSADQMTVQEIAHIVIEEMGCQDVNLLFTKGVDGGRGWYGDVKIMQLSIEKMRQKGWRPKHSSREAVRLTVQDMIDSI